LRITVIIRIEIEEVICDICGTEKAYRKCEVCGRDVCQNCNIELYKRKTLKTKTSVERPEYFSDLFGLLPTIEEHEYLCTMCKECFGRFVELSKMPSIIKAYEIIASTTEHKTVSH